MTKESTADRLFIEAFKTPFERGPENKKAKGSFRFVLPPGKLEIYGCSLGRGVRHPAKPSCAAVGAVMIKHKLRPRMRGASGNSGRSILRCTWRSANV
jgi:hypothetical protein